LQREDWHLHVAEDKEHDILAWMMMVVVVVVLVVMMMMMTMTTIVLLLLLLLMMMTRVGTHSLHSVVHRLTLQPKYDA
jgi:hypothetical protein